MATADQIADQLLDSDAGVIAVINILDGMDIGLYDFDFARSILWWWGELVVHTGATGLLSAKTLGSLVDLFDGVHPPGFAAPPIPLATPYIVCRRDDDLPDPLERASVRDAPSLQYWVTSSSMDDLKDDGIDPYARAGTPTYALSMEALRPDYYREVEIDLAAEATLTNKRRGARAIMFYTTASELLTMIAAAPEDARADTARDNLGLVHIKSDVQHVTAVFPSDGTEGRDDRGRPTVVDAGGNPRFLSKPDGYTAADAWGRTANLSKIPAGWPNVGAMRERVCGPYPDYSGGPPASVTVGLHFLGVASVPRGDDMGVGDIHYADLLSKRWEAAHSVPVRQRVIEILAGSIA